MAIEVLLMKDSKLNLRGGVTLLFFFKAMQLEINELRKYIETLEEKAKENDLP